jgi:C4-dicarboxylate transporter, DctQ subunit
VINKILNHLEEWIIATLMGAATLLIFVAVVHRAASGASWDIQHYAYVHEHFPNLNISLSLLQDTALKINLSWAQELCIYMFVWMAKFGAAYGVREGVHVGVDVLIARLPAEWRKTAVYVALFGGMFFTGVIGTLGLRFVWENGMHYAVFHLLGMDTGDLPEGPTTPDLEWPTWCIYSAVWMGSYLMCYRFIQVAIAFWKTGEMPHHDEAAVEGLDDMEMEELPGIGQVANLRGAQ